MCEFAKNLLLLILFLLVFEVEYEFIMYLLLMLLMNDAFFRILILLFGTNPNFFHRWLRSSFSRFRLNLSMDFFAWACNIFLVIWLRFRVVRGSCFGCFVDENWMLYFDESWMFVGPSVCVFCSSRGSF